MHGFEKVSSFFWFRALIGIRECQTSDLRKSSTGNFIWVSGASCGVLLVFLGFFDCFCWFFPDYWITMFRRLDGVVCLMPACSAHLKKLLSLFWYKPPTIKFCLWLLNTWNLLYNSLVFPPSFKSVQDGVKGTCSNSCVRKFGYIISGSLNFIVAACSGDGLEWECLGTIRHLWGLIRPPGCLEWGNFQANEPSSHQMKVCFLKTTLCLPTLHSSYQVGLIRCCTCQRC